MIRIFQTIIIAFMAIAPVAMMAQTEYGFKSIAVEQDFTENGFNWFKHALLLAAGNEQQSNAMTIGWGGIGTLWRKTAVTVYVAEKRYTKQFMDNAQYFTIMAFANRKDEQYLAKLVKNDDILENDCNLSVSSYVEQEDTREEIIISEVNAKLETLVAEGNELNKKIDAIVKEL